jgi:hypothetical protein
VPFSPQPTELAPSDRPLFSISGHEGEDSGEDSDEEGELTEDGQVVSCRFKNPSGFTVKRAGNVMVADNFSHALRKMTKEAPSALQQRIQRCGRRKMATLLCRIGDYFLRT